MIENLNVDSVNWVSSVSGARDRGLVRCEWLTATHNSGNEFTITAKFATLDLDQELLLSTTISSGEIDSVTPIFPVADFHEREVAQMFGIRFTGNDCERLAFETEFNGYPLRRDFALSTRVETAWPGSVEPDESARRRPSLPPGIFEEWQK
jgi:NADH-quinone oxidoreductase subunit C